MSATARVSSPNACDERPRLHSGSSRWASKPAETIRRPGSKSRSARQRLVLEGVHEPALRRPGGERDVHRRALARAAAPLGAAPGPRIERVLVERHVEHVRVVPEDRLGAVAVVGVPVEHRHPLDAGGPRVRRRDGGVVHQAEAHGAGRLGVVAGRPAEAERGPDVAGQHGVDRRRGGARGDDRGVVAPLAHDRVEVDRPSARARRARGCRRGTRGGCTRSRSSVRRRRRAPRPAHGRPHGVHHGIDPRRPLRVRPRIVQPEEVGHVTDRTVAFVTPPSYKRIAGLLRCSPEKTPGLTSA